MKRRAVLVSSGGSREYLTVTIAAHTRARIDALATSTGLARGRLVDLAIGALEACEPCRGTGRVDGLHGAGTEECSWCRGSRVVPSG